MHFFKTKYLIPNIPLTKITDLPLSKPAPSNSSSIKTFGLYFPAQNNGIHKRRWLLYKHFYDDIVTRNHLITQRSSIFSHWLALVSTSKYFIYHSLGSSIGLNNILPASFASVNILANRLAEFTGQSVYYDFGARVLLSFFRRGIKFSDSRSTK